MRILELFAGIGGCAAAASARFGEDATAIVAVEQSPVALAVYRQNHGHEILERNIVGLRARDLPEADLWWMSPPCQPYTVRGKRRDLDDPRAASLVRLMALLPERRPRWLALENVQGFVGSQAHALMRETLDRLGYRVAERALCPTDLGIPNHRPRFYLAARCDGVEPRWPRPTLHRATLADYLDTDPAADLVMGPDLVRRYAGAIHLLEPDDPEAISHCFTSAYGRSPVRSGSYLAVGADARRFSPTEILRLLHFPATYRFPAGTTRRKAWGLVGNSLSVAAAGEVLGAFDAG